MPSARAKRPASTVETWGVYEAGFQGPTRGNPFLDVTLGAVFSHGHRSIEVEGFYDGDGVYRVRFSPDREGSWSFVTRSNRPELDGQRGSFQVGPPKAGNHGPVRVQGTFHFAHEDGTFHSCVGTTCYVWTLQGDRLAEQTLRTLEEAPFNKLRMCVFPKHYKWNNNEPACYPFEQKGRARTKAPWRWDTTRFVPAYFQALERRVGDLRDRGIEADIILFHPYDRWGFSTLGAEADERYLRYLVARLAAYRNVWWSLANEWDLFTDKKAEDFDRLGRLVAELDPYQHPRSIHNCWTQYDHAKPWITHCSIQEFDTPLWQDLVRWRETFRKPVVIDENRYEGDVPTDWGSLSAQELVHRFWMAAVAGTYNGHSESYLHGSGKIWWSHGGVLRGESAKRIGFLRRVVEEGGNEGWTPVWRRVCPWTATKGERVFLMYFGPNQPREWTFDRLPAGRFRLELIDPWAMTVRPLADRVKSGDTIRMPRKPGLAVRATRLRPA